MCVKEESSATLPLITYINCLQENVDLPKSKSDNLPEHI